jgi:hypothetical protein
MQYQHQKNSQTTSQIKAGFTQTNRGSISTLTHEIHQRAIQASQQFLNAESTLIEILQQVDQHRVFIEYGHSSLFHYVTNELKISESVAYNLITVSRKAREVPALQAAIQKQQITLSNARKITPILNQSNQEVWIQKAQTLSLRQLEKEIARENPKLATPEKVTYATAERVQITFGLSEKDMIQLRRVQDLLCKTRQNHVSLEDTLVAMTEDFLSRKDPIKKAKRIIAKKGLHSDLTTIIGGEISASVDTTPIATANLPSVTRNLPSATSSLPSATSSLPSATSSLPSATANLTSFTTSLTTAAAIASSVFEAASINPTKAVNTPVARQEGSEISNSRLFIHSTTKIREFNNISDQNSTNKKPYARTPIPAQVAHQVWLRDQGRCTHHNQDGFRCKNTRYIEMHHIKPVASGGDNSLNNLTTLCTSHHRHLHSRN